jgi:RHS repeat-associated protein
MPARGEASSGPGQAAYFRRSRASLQTITSDGSTGGETKFTHPDTVSHCLRVDWPAPHEYLTHHTRDTGFAGPEGWAGSLVGGMRDASGQMYMRNRFYDPQSGRFTQEGPMGIAGANTYGLQTQIHTARGCMAAAGARLTCDSDDEVPRSHDASGGTFVEQTGGECFLASFLQFSASSGPSAAPRAAVQPEPGPAIRSSSATGKLRNTCFAARPLSSAVISSPVKTLRQRPARMPFPPVMRVSPQTPSWGRA